MTSLCALLAPASALAQTSDIAEIDGEIVVTASKRAERLIDLPISVTAVQTDDLAETGQVKLEDYAAKIPGLVVQNGAYGGSSTSVTLRGIGSSYGSGPTVAIYVNDIAFNNSARATLGSSIPDLDPSDFERIEVLRGPQGTLYGGGTIGGVIKYVAKLPRYDAFSGRIEIGGTTVSHGDQGYSLRAGINAPLSDRVALRVSGFYREDAGFIDNLALGRDDVNRVHKYGGRAVLGVKLSDDVTARLEGFFENSHVKGNPLKDLSLATLAELTPGLSYNRAPNTDDSRRDSKLIALHLDADLGFADLVSVSSYSRNKNETNWDYSPALIPPIRAILGVTVPAAARIYNNQNSKKITQELRLTSPNGQRFSWQLAGFYTKETARPDQYLTIVGATSGEMIPLPTLGDTLSKQRYREIAGFANASYAFTDSFDISAGIRYTHSKQSGTQVTDGLLLGAVTTVTSSSESPVTYMVSPRYRFSKNAMAYFRLATGYRPGGSNPFVPGTPTTYGSDKTINYEFGFKAETDDRRLAVDLSAFYIDWSKIQIFGLSSLSTSFIYNGGEARSKGLEASGSYRPIDRLTLSGNFAYTDAKLTRDLPPPNVGLKGDRLPGVSKFSALAAADYEWSLASDWKANIGASFRHVGKRPDQLEANRYILPSYNTIDLRAGVGDERYSINLFVTNLTDERGQLSSFNVATERRVIITTPRTIGITASANF